MYYVLMNAVLNLINTLMEGVLVVLPPIFVFAVSLLGDAIDRSIKESAKTEELNIKELNSQIDKLKQDSANLTEAMGGPELKNLENQILNLRNHREQTEKDKDKIRNKYNSLRLKQGVILPALMSIAVLFINKVLFDHIHDNAEIFIVIGIEVVLLWEIVTRLYNTLFTIEIIAAEIDDRKNKKIEEITEKATRSALLALEEIKKPKVELLFDDAIGGKLVFKKDEESKLNYTLSVNKDEGAVQAKNVSVTFYLPKGVEIIPSNNVHINLTMQESYWLIPNASSCAIAWAETLDRGTNYQDSFKLKSSVEIVGQIAYRVSADNFVGELKTHNIEVHK